MVLVLKACRGYGEQLRLALGEAIGEDAASEAVECAGPKGSCKEAEVWHHEERLLQAVCVGAAQLQQKTPVFWRCQYRGMTTENCSSSEVEAAGAEKTICVCCRGRGRRSDSCPVGVSPEDHEWIPDNWTLELFILLELGCAWFR